MTATRLMLSFLAIASFAPVAIGLRPGRWAIYYYGTLFVWWVLMSVVTVRLATPERPDGGARHGERREGWTARRSLGRRSSNKRLVIVGSARADLYSRIRRKHLGDEAVRVITDRRGPDRRRRLEVYIPDRRRAERRCVNIEPLLRTRGWAEVRLPDS